MDELKYDNYDDIDLEQLELVHNLNVPDSYEDGVFPTLEFMIDVDDE